MRLPELKEGMEILCVESDRSWWVVGNSYPVVADRASALVIKDEEGDTFGYDDSLSMKFEVIYPEEVLEEEEETSEEETPKILTPDEIVALPEGSIIKCVFAYNKWWLVGEEYTKEGGHFLDEDGDEYDKVNLSDNKSNFVLVSTPEEEVHSNIFTPIIGEPCMMSKGDLPLIECTPRFLGENIVVVDITNTWKEESFYTEEITFSPLISEKELAIKGIQDTLNKTTSEKLTDTFTDGILFGNKPLAEGLYEAGYRLVKGDL